MRVEVASQVSRSPSPARVRSLLERTSRLLRSEIRNPESEISILFCGDAKMRGLNRRYRGKDRATDVLAFPARADGLLGDIVISVPFAARQARRRGEPLSREIDRLLLHGLLHLCGYDHETDRGEMDALEAEIRRRLRLEERRP